MHQNSWPCKRDWPCRQKKKRKAFTHLNISLERGPLLGPFHYDKPSFSEGDEKVDYADWNMFEQRGWPLPLIWCKWGSQTFSESQELWFVLMDSRRTPIPNRGGITQHSKKRERLRYFNIVYGRKLDPYVRGIISIFHLTHLVSPVSNIVNKQLYPNAAAVGYAKQPVCKHASALGCPNLWNSNILVSHSNDILKINLW